MESLPSNSPLPWFPGSEIPEGWSCQWIPMQRRHSVTSALLKSMAVILLATLLPPHPIPNSTARANSILGNYWYEPITLLWNQGSKISSPFYTCSTCSPAKWASKKKVAWLKSPLLEDIAISWVPAFPTAQSAACFFPQSSIFKQLIWTQNISLSL